MSELRDSIFTDREAAEYRLYHILNSREWHKGRAKLFRVAGLGTCLVQWTGLRWECRWFDDAEEAPRE